MMFKVIINIKKEGFFFGETTTTTTIVVETKSFIDAQLALKEKFTDQANYYTNESKNRNTWCKIDPERYTIRTDWINMKFDLIIE